MNGLRTFLVAIGVLALAGLLIWAIAEAPGLGSLTGGSASLTGIIVLGALGVGGLTAALMWLAFYSDNKGYDEPPVIEHPHEHAPPDGQDGTRP